MAARAGEPPSTKSQIWVQFISIDSVPRSCLQRCAPLLKMHTQDMCLDLPKGAKWFIKGVNSPSLRVKLALLGRCRCWYTIFLLICNMYLLLVHPKAFYTHALFAPHKYHWLVHRDPCNGLLWSPHNWVVWSPTYPKQPRFSSIAHMFCAIHHSSWTDCPVRPFCVPIESGKSFELPNVYTIQPLFDNVRYLKWKMAVFER